MPKVSVIIPNYNHAVYLKARIDSVLNQSFKDFEIILLDDASNDNSLEIINNFSSDPRFHIILNSQNSGSTFSQWNLGIKIAKGDYIWIAESDDLADPEFLDSLVPVMDHNDSIVIAYSQSKEIDKHGFLIRSMEELTHDLDKKKWKNNYINNGNDERKTYLAVKNTIPNASAVVFRRRTYEDIETDVKLQLCGDWLIWSRLLQKGNIFYCAQELNFFRRHDNNVRTAVPKSKHLSEYYEVINEIIKSENYRTTEINELALRLYRFWSSFLQTYKISDIKIFILFLARFSKLKALSLLCVLTVYKVLRVAIPFVPSPVLRFMKIVLKKK